MEELKNTLKAQIIEALNLEDIEVSDISDSEPLFGDGLGLDSIDALELIVLLEREYGIKMDDAAQGKTALQSVNSMAEFIQAQQAK